MFAFATNVIKRYGRICSLISRILIILYYNAYGEVLTLQVLERLWDIIYFDFASNALNFDKQFLQ